MFLEALEVFRRKELVEGRWSWESGADGTRLRLFGHFCRLVCGLQE